MLTCIVFFLLNVYITPLNADRSDYLDELDIEGDHDFHEEHIDEIHTHDDDDVPKKLKIDDDTDDIPIDDEEFIGDIQIKKNKKNIKKNIQQQQQQQSSSDTVRDVILPFTVMNYLPELTAIFFIIIYAINFWIGKRKNDAIAKQW